MTTRARTPIAGAATRAAFALFVGALALAAAACATVEPQANLPANVPEYRYETPRTVTAAIPRERALAVLKEVLARSRTPRNEPLRHTVADDRFGFRWSMMARFDADFGEMDESSVKQSEHAFDFTFAEVETVIIDLTSLGGRIGVKFKKDGADVPFAYFCTRTLEDAETIHDAIAVLAARG